MSNFKTEYEAIPIRRYVELMRAYRPPPEYHIRWFNGLLSLTPDQIKRKSLYRAKVLAEEQEYKRFVEHCESCSKQYDEEDDEEF
jgi:hypothetical protein